MYLLFCIRPQSATSALMNIHDYISRHCEVLEKRISEFLVLYEQPHVHHHVQLISKLYRGEGLVHCGIPLLSPYIIAQIS